MAMLNIGDKVTYEYNGKTREGVIHSVRSYENPKTKQAESSSYLIDTGRADRVDEHIEDERDVEIMKRVIAKKPRDAQHQADLVKEVTEQKDLPKSKTRKVQIRQPQLVEVSPDNVSLAE